jgi:hypothetical protein
VRLKDDVSVRKNHGYAVLPDAFDYFESIREESLLKWILEQKMRNSQHVQIARIVGAVTLEGAEIIRVANFAAQFFKDGPVALLAFVPNLLFEVGFEVGGHRVVIEQSIVYVE